ncbi:integrase core domain protein [Oesophagostomum dentatum]|uniref:Integrase core domain protein n=1 Tax=Oesophagostomum dentatum TaxID=61180 RepID=A0A0B1TE36_OESDE|nr:integrase core domain protein [Oesophagostomum dentatum]
MLKPGRFQRIQNARPPPMLAHGNPSMATRTHSDIIGPLPLTLDGNKYIIMFVDAFSKYVTAEALPGQKANTTMQTFTNRFVPRFGLSETLVTDQGSNYVNDGFRSLQRNLHIHHRTSTPYHHESNGQVERTNRTLEELIAMAIKQYHDEWDQAVYHNVQGNISHAQEQQKHHYDLRKRHITRNCQTGAKIWIRRENAQKIAPKYEGPYPIVDANIPKVTIRDGQRARTIHINRTKLYHGEDEEE